MTAAGSLFTSCIEQVEPLGVQDLRFAKAEYIRALKDLRAADAEFRRAEAALKQAEARNEDAQTAMVLAQVEMQNLKNEYQALLNLDLAGQVEYNEAERQAKLEELEMKMEALRAKHEQEMVEAAEALAKAEEQLRVTLRNIALAAQSLTAEEKEAVLYAAAAYELAFEAVQKQKVEVMEAQRIVDSLKWVKANFTDKEWFLLTEAYEDKIAVWSFWQSLAEADAAEAMAKYNAVPEKAEDYIADLAEWKQTLDGYESAMAEAEYNLHDFAEKVNAYYIQYVHDGYEAYNKELATWMEDNKMDGEHMLDGAALNLTAAEKKIIEKGEPKEEDYTVGYADTIAFPVLKPVDGQTFNWFNNMLWRYFWKVPTATSKLNYTIQVISWDSDAQGYVLNADHSMKDFVLGHVIKEEGKGSELVHRFYDTEDEEKYYDLKASYGLKGAISVLERKGVVETDDTNKADSLKYWKKTWEDNRATLKAVYQEYQSQAADKKDEGKALLKYAPYKEANDNVTTVTSEVNGVRTAVAEAVNTLKSELGKLKGRTDLNSTDSIAIIKAIENYAKVRDEKLAYKPGYTTTLGTSDIHVDSTYFYYAKGTFGGKAVIDSVKFSELTKVGRLYLEYDATKDGDTKYATVSGKGFANAFANILNQLLGADFAAQFVNYKPDTKDCDFTGLDFFSQNRFFNQYKIKADTKDPKKAVSVIVLYGKEKDKELGQSKIDAAVGKRDDAKAAYQKVYKSYWGCSAYPGIANELNPELYALETFTDPYCIVNWFGNPSIWTTQGFWTVMDALNRDYGVVSEDIFGEDMYSDYAYNNPLQSDFYKYMYWLDRSDSIDKDSLKVLQDWVKAVEDAFKADEEAAGKLDEKAYKAAKKKYDAAVTKKEALIKFTGKDKDGNPNGIIPLYANYANPEVFFDNWTWTLFFELAEKDIFDEFSGKWIAELDGEQKAVAEKYFPALPEKMKEFEQGLKKLVHDYDHAAISYDNLSEVYLIAAQAKGYAEANKSADFDEWVERVQEKLDGLRVKYYNQYVEALMEANQYAKQIADYYSEMPIIDIAIADAEADLAIQQHRLAALEKALAYAKENLNRIIEYLKSLDVNYILLTGEDASTYGGAASSYIK